MRLYKTGMIEDVITQVELAGRFSYALIQKNFNLPYYRVKELKAELIRRRVIGADLNVIKVRDR